MKNYTITVNGNVYDVTVEENGSVATPAAAPRRAAAPVAAPAPAAAPAATGAAGSVPRAEAGRYAGDDDGIYHPGNAGGFAGTGAERVERKAPGRIGGPLCRDGDGRIQQN